MERDNRRNSILKPAACWNQVNNQASAIEYEEDQTENFTTSRRKSLKKRVSFSGRNEIKEFQKHEVLTIEKLEKALIKLHQDESQQLCNSVGTKSDCGYEKENVQQQAGTQTEMFSESNDNMDITTMMISSVVHDCVAQEMEMELSMCSTIQIYDVSTADRHQHFSSEELKISYLLPSKSVKERAVPSVQTSENYLVNDVDLPLVQERIGFYSPPNEIIGSSETIEICPEKETISVNSTYCSVEVLKVAEPVVENLSFQDFCVDETGEFYQLALKLNWKVKYQDNELVLSKSDDYLTLKLKLDFEYTHQNIRHYVVEDIEIDTKKDVEDKWARFGFSVLENTLEHCNLLEICSNTQDLPKLIHTVEEHNRTFLEFVVEDSTKFEILANPRSIKFDTDYSKLTFELCNLENLVWIRINLSLNPLFPLTAKDIAIESILGNLNKAELINMVSTIRPSCLYLTRVAECIEDFLKFRPTTNERKILNRTCTDDGRQ